MHWKLNDNGQRRFGGVRRRVGTQNTGLDATQIEFAAKRVADLLLH
jgi:hypothetical protein